jgi:hypothetical protein
VQNGMRSETVEPLSYRCEAKLAGKAIIIRVAAAGAKDEAEAMVMGIEMPVQQM